MQCPECSAWNPDGSGFCLTCGKKFPERQHEEYNRNLRLCVSCGRSIDFNANVCQYCGHDYRYPRGKRPEPPISPGMRALLYIVSFLVGIVGIVIGAIYMSREDEDHRHVGKICLIIGLFGVIITPIVLSAVLYLMVLGF